MSVMGRSRPRVSVGVTRVAVAVQAAFEGVSRMTKTIRFGLVGAALAISVFVATSLVLGDTALAARGCGGGGGKPSGGGSSISLNQADPHLGDAVTFTTSGGSSITVNCFQGGLGNLVYAARQATGTTFVLGGGSSAWQSGPASCVVYLYSRDKYLASTGFEAAGAR